MILITGATGTNGFEIVKLLSRMGVTCRALVRPSDKSAAFANLPGVEVAYGDFGNRETLAPALEGIDRALLISSIDPKLPELQGTFIRAARAAGVRHVVKFSGMDADVRSEWRFLRWHAEAERALEDSGLAFTHLQPNQFMQVYLRSQPTITAQGKFFAASKDSLVSPVDVRDIAAVAVAVLTGSGHEGKKYVITGPEALTYADVADKLSSAIGKKVIYVDILLEAVKKATLDSGAPEWFAEGQMEQLQVLWEGKQSRLTSTIAEVAKKEPITSPNSRETSLRIFAERKAPLQ